MDTMLNNSTKMLIHLSVLILLILDSQIEPTACFWLTDGISLQPATSFVKQPSRPAAEVSTETVSPAPSGDDVKLIGTNAFAATNRLEPWVWLTGAQQADGKQQQQLQSSNRVSLAPGDPLRIPLRLRLGSMISAAKMFCIKKKKKKFVCPHVSACTRHIDCTQDDNLTLELLSVSGDLLAASLLWLLHCLAFARSRLTALRPHAYVWIWAAQDASRHK